MQYDSKERRQGLDWAKSYSSYLQQILALLICRDSLFVVGYSIVLCDDCNDVQQQVHTAGTCRAQLQIHSDT